MDQEANCPPTPKYTATQLQNCNAEIISTVFPTVLQNINMAQLWIGSYYVTIFPFEL